MLAQEVSVVSALLADQQSRLDLHKFLSHPVVHQRRHLNPSQLIMDRRIEPTRHDDQVGLKLLSDWEQQGLASTFVLTIAKLALLVVLPVLLI